MTSVIILQGLSGLGKSTLTNQVLEETLFGGVLKVLSLDAIRGELYGDPAIQGERDSVLAVGRNRLHSWLAQGHSVIVDVTSTRRIEYDTWAEIVREHGIKPFLVRFPLELELAKERNKERESAGLRFVPEEILEVQYRNLVEFDYSGLWVEEILSVEAFKRRVGLQ